MKYLSIDIETSGLDIDKCDIIQFAAVIDDLDNPQPLKELPKLNVYFLKNFYRGEPIALSMHSKIFEKIANAKKNEIEYDEVEEAYYIEIKYLTSLLRNFLTKNGISEDYQTGSIVVNVAGKNVSGFDIPFLNAKIKDWDHIYFRTRTMDPAILYFDPQKDKEMPNMATCMNRARIEGKVSHTALEDALTVIELIRNKF